MDKKSPAYPVPVDIQLDTKENTLPIEAFENYSVASDLSKLILDYAGIKPQISIIDDRRLYIKLFFGSLDFKAFFDPINTMETIDGKVYLVPSALDNHIIQADRQTVTGQLTDNILELKTSPSYDPRPNSFIKILAQGLLAYAFAFYRKGEIIYRGVESLKFYRRKDLDCPPSKSIVSGCPHDRLCTMIEAIEQDFHKDDYLSGMSLEKILLQFVKWYGLAAFQLDPNYKSTDIDTQ